MKAGPMLQKELNATKQGAEEEVGSILMTSGCDLDCKAVLHVVAPGWDNGARSLQVEKDPSSLLHLIALVIFFWHDVDQWYSTKVSLSSRGRWLLITAPGN